MPQAASMSAPPTGRHQRRLKNYILDAHFQLKYTAYLVGIALLFSVCLGTLLWRTSAEVIAQSAQTVQQGEIDKLDQAIKTLEPKAEPGELDPLYQLRQEMIDALNT